MESFLHLPFDYYEDPKFPAGLERGNWTNDAHSDFDSVEAGLVSTD